MIGTQTYHCHACQTVHSTGYRCYVGATTIDEWYDRHTRSWVVQLKDAEGNQLGEAEYSGTKSGSAYVVGLMLQAAPHLKLASKAA